MIKRDVTYSELNNYCWTEDNRMQGMSDKNNGAWYNYDATGERNLKLTGQTMHVNQNGQDYYTPIFDQQTLYANPLIIRRAGFVLPHNIIIRICNPEDLQY